MMIIHVDGAGWNGKVSRLCVIAFDTGEKVVITTSENWTNNVAEYKAVLQGLAIATSLDTIYSDSTVVVNQVNGSYACNAKHLQELRDEVRKKLNMTGAKLRWISGKENRASDWLRRQKSE